MTVERYERLVEAGVYRSAIRSSSGKGGSSRRSQGSPPWLNTSSGSPLLEAQMPRPGFPRRSGVIPRHRRPPCPSPTWRILRRDSVDPTPSAYRGRRESGFLVEVADSAWPSTPGRSLRGLPTRGGVDPRLLDRQHPQGRSTRSTTVRDRAARADLSRAPRVRPRRSPGRARFSPSRSVGSPFSEILRLEAEDGENGRA